MTAPHVAGPATDHAGLEPLPLADCLALLASVPVGRLAFPADGEVLVLPVNHAVDGQDVVFRTGYGTKLAAAQREGVVSFQADRYDEATCAGWSVLVTGRAEMVLDAAEIGRFEALGLRTWADAASKPFWVRVRPTSVTGRRIVG